MKTYKFEKEYSYSEISIGDKLYIGDEVIVVVAIIKVNTADGTIWFTGVPSPELE